MPVQPTPIIFKITDEGKQAALDGENTGLSLNITELAYGSGQYTPAGNETALMNEIGRTNIVGGGVNTSTNTLRFSSTLNTDALIDIYELGLFTDQNELFAVASSTDKPMLTVHPGIAFVGSFGLALADIDASSITVTTDPDGSIATVLMQQHLSADNPHPQYPLSTEVADLISQLTSRIDTLEANMIRGSFVIKETSDDSGIRHDEINNADEGHITISGVYIEEIVGIAPAPTVISYTSEKRDKKIMNGRVDITKDYINKVVVPVPDYIENINQITLESQIAVITVRYGGGDYKVFSDPLTMSLNISSNELTINGIWVDQIKLSF